MLFRTLSDERLWDPFEAIDRIRQEMERSLDGRLGLSEAFPRMNLSVGEDAAVLTVELPGVHPENVDLSVEEDTLTVSGERAADEEGEVLRRERHAGAFARAIKLPFRVNAERTEARFRNGLLRVTLPRAEEAKPRKIAVKAEK